MEIYFYNPDTNTWCFIKNNDINLIKMQKYICTNCKYVYSPYIGDEEQNIESWTDFLDVDEFWTCPSCHEWKDSFMEIMPSIQEVYNMDNITPEEERHIPFYKINDWKIYIKVWTEDNTHPNDEDHFIEYIWIFDEMWDEIEIINFPDIQKEMIFDISELDFFEVRASCNLNWVWKWAEES